MKHLFRFHGKRTGDRSWELFEEEWHHILKVLRLEAGDLIELANGQGWVAHATLGDLGKTKGGFQIVSEAFTPRLSVSDEFTLGLGVLKPQGIDEVLPGLVELGLHRLILIPFRGMDKSRLSEKLLDRWQRQIISASKQAKAPWFPELVIAKSLDAFLESSQEFPSRFLLDPLGEVQPLSVLSVPGPVLAVVGSEGGWSDDELSKLREGGFQALRIRSYILRATTAVLATTAIFRQCLALDNLR